MAVDSQWSNVTLLLPMEGANNQTIITDVKGHVVTVSNGAALSTAVGSPFGAGAAAYFDGSNDALAATSADFTMGTGDFSIKFALYPLTGGHGASYGRLLAIGPDATSGGLYIVTNSTNDPMTFLLQSHDGSAYTAVTDYVATTVSNGAWHWAQLDRVGGVFNFYVDGTLYATKTVTRNLTRTELVLGNNTAANAGFKGYIGPVYILKGAVSSSHAVPSGPFARPTISGITYNSAGAPTAKTVLVAKRSTQVLLGGANSDPSTGAYAFNPPDFSECTVYCIDEVADPYQSSVIFADRLNASGFPTLTGQTITVNGTVTASAAVADPFGGAQPSALFAGAATDYLTSSGTLLPGTVYTVSGWFRVTSLAAAQGIFFFGTHGSDTNRVMLAIDSTNAYLNFFGYGTGSLFSITSANGSIATNTWYHFAAVRNGTNVYLFINGAHAASGAVSGTESTGSTLRLGYCRYGGADRGLVGRIFDAHYSNRAEYLAPFTPPTALLPAAFADGGSAGFAEIRDRVVPG